MGAQLPAGPRSPSAVQTFGWFYRPTAYMDRLRGRHGTTFSLQLTFQPPFVILADPDAIRELLTAPPDVLHPGEGAKLLEPVVGANSVILLDEDAHMRQRKLMLPAFHGEKMERLRALMVELTEREVDAWPVGEPIATHPRLQKLTLEIILRAVFGLDEGPRLDRLRDTLSRILVFGESPVSLLPPIQKLLSGHGRFGQFDRDRADVDRELFALMDERRASGEERDDVLAMLLGATDEDGDPMSDEEIRDELLTALVAGHETTASSLAFACEQLARAPAPLDRIADGEDGWLDATVNEVLRRRPVLPNPEPRLVVKPVTIGGRGYPPGVVLVASAYLVHHDPAIYPDPRSFRPERFLGVRPGTYTFLPFGGGRRRCLGASFALLEMRVALQAIAERFTLSAEGPAPVPRRRMITLTSGDGGTVTLRPRAGVKRHLRAVPAAA